jgi:flagellar hook-basal body complex protein FliE
VSNLIAGLGAGNILGNIPSIGQAGGAGNEGGFSGFLSNALHQVNELNSSADQQVSNLLQGRSADMSSVMVAVEKADVSFQLMMQVRNKIVNAYQDLEKMQF